MSGQRRGPGRGTRMGKGVLSGSTIITAPSGVTLDKHDHVHTDEGYCPTYSTSHYKWKYGTADCASSAVSHATGSVSNVLQISTGLTATYGFWPTILSDDVSGEILSGVSVAPILTVVKTASAVSVISHAVSSAGAAAAAGVTPVKLFYKGVSCHWLAFGT